MKKGPGKPEGATPGQARRPSGVRKTGQPLKYDASIPETATERASQLIFKVGG